MKTPLISAAVLLLAACPTPIIGTDTKTDVPSEVDFADSDVDADSDGDSDVDVDSDADVDTADTGDGPFTGGSGG